MLIKTSLGDLSCVERGQGTPLLLLPANGHDGRAFDAVVPALSQRFRTLAVDWPGTGASPRPTSARPPSAPMMADMIEELVQRLDLRDTVIMGNSIGGFAALRLAARSPERVRSLVVVNSGGFSPVDRLTRAFCWLKGQPWFTRACGVAFARTYIKERNAHVQVILDAIRDGVAREDYLDVETSIWRQFPEPGNDVRADASRVVCPTLLVWGRRDPVSRTRVEGRRARAAMPSAQYVELPSGHVPFAEVPEAFLAATMPFLS